MVLWHCKVKFLWVLLSGNQIKRHPSFRKSLSPSNLPIPIFRQWFLFHYPKWVCTFWATSTAGEELVKFCEKKTNYFKRDRFVVKLILPVLAPQTTRANRRKSKQLILMINFWSETMEVIWGLLRTEESEPRALKALITPAELMSLHWWCCRKCSCCLAPRGWKLTCVTSYCLPKNLAITRIQTSY